MKKIKEVIIVEGKTDTAILKQLYDVETIETKGLQLDKNNLNLIQKVAEERGIIIFTDPDFPGQKIRHTLNELIPNAKNAFIRKEDAIGKNKVGLAEAKKEAIIQALDNVVTFGNDQKSLTWEDFIDLGIIGDKDKRLKIYERFNLGYGNVKTLFKRLNLVGIKKEEIISALDYEKDSHN